MAETVIHQVRIQKTGFNRRLIAPMVLGSILNPINSSIISIALIPIGRAFNAPPSETAWLISALYLATAIGQPVVGKLIDTFGPRLLYLLGTLLVGLASLIAIFSPQLWWLVIARVLLGFGTCAGYPSSMYLIRSESERTGEKSPSGILTILAVANQTIAVIGPTLGGLLIQVGGWQSTFLVNLPLSLACVILGWLYFPRTAALKKADDTRTTGKFDLLGMALFALMLTTLLFFLMNPQLKLMYLLLITVISALVMAWVELRFAKAPFIDLKVFAGNLPLIATYVRSLLTATISYCFLYGFTQWLEEGRGLSPSQAGMLLLPLFITAIAVSSLTGKSPKIRPKLLWGVIIQLIASILMLFVNGESSIIFLIVIVLVLGIPQGLLNLANQNAVYYQARKEQIGASAGLLRTFMYLGAIVASSANGIFLKQGAGSIGMHHVTSFMVIVGGLLAILTIADCSLKKVIK
ncbi:MAG: MFS transporter [Sporolactobacillus sp.]